MRNDVLEEGLVGDFLSDIKYKSKKDYRSKQADKYSSIKADKITALEDLLSISQMLDSIDGGKYSLYCADDLDLQLGSLKYKLNNLNVYDRRQLKSIINMLNAGAYDKFMALCSGEIYNKYVKNTDPIKLTIFLSHYLDYENGKIPADNQDNAENTDQADTNVDQTSTTDNDGTDASTDSADQTDTNQVFSNINDISTVEQYHSILAPITIALMSQQMSKVKINQLLVNFFADNFDITDPIYDIFNNICINNGWKAEDAYGAITNISSNIINNKDILFNPNFILSIPVNKSTIEKVGPFEFNYYISCFKLRDLYNNLDLDSEDIEEKLNFIRLYTKNFDASIVISSDTKLKQSIKNNVNSELNSIKSISRTPHDKEKMRPIFKLLRQCDFCD